MTANLPTRRTRDGSPALPTPATRVIDGQVLRSATAGWIRQVEFMHLPGDKVMLNGPVHQVRHILMALRRRREVLGTNDPAPSDRGVMLTLTLAPPVVRGRTQLGRPPNVKPWTRRRKAVVFGALLPGVTLAILAVAWVWPLVGVAAAAGLLTVAWLWAQYQRQHHASNVPHVAIDHID